MPRPRRVIVREQIRKPPARSREFQAVAVVRRRRARMTCTACQRLPLTVVIAGAFGPSGRIALQPIDLAPGLIRLHTLTPAALASFNALHRRLYLLRSRATLLQSD